MGKSCDPLHMRWNLATFGPETPVKRGNDEALRTTVTCFNGFEAGLRILYKNHTPDHIRIPGIGLELACN